MPSTSVFCLLDSFEDTGIFFCGEKRKRDRGTVRRQLVVSRVPTGGGLLTRTAKVVLFSVVSVCVCVCLSVNTIASEPLEIYIITKFSGRHPMVRKGGQVRKWLLRGARVVRKRP